MLITYLSLLDDKSERKQFFKIYNANKFTMLHIAMGMLKGDQKAAEDAVHSSFLALIKNKEKYFQLSCSDLRRSCVIIVKRKCIDIMRREERYDYNENDVIKNTPSDDDSLEEQMIKKEEYARLRKHMAELSESSRNILEMKYVAQMSYKEIAEILNISEKLVETRLYRAKEKVRNAMLKEEA